MVKRSNHVLKIIDNMINFILVVILERLQGYIIEIAYCTLAIYTIRITDHALYEASLIDPIEMIDTNFIDKNLLIR